MIEHIVFNSKAEFIAWLTLNNFDYLEVEQFYDEMQDTHVYEVVFEGINNRYQTTQVEELEE